MPAKKTVRKTTGKTPAKPAKNNAQKPVVAKKAVAAKKTPAVKSKAVAKTSARKVPATTSKPESRPTLWQAAPRPKETIVDTLAPAQPTKPNLNRNDVLLLTLSYIWRYFFVMLSSLAVTICMADLAARFIPQSNLAAHTLVFGIIFLGTVGMAIYALYWTLTAPRLFGPLHLSLTPRQPRFFRQLCLFWLSFFWRSFLLNILFSLFTVVTKLTVATYIGREAIYHPYYLWPENVYTIIITPILSSFFTFYLLLRKQNFRWGKLELLRLKS